MYLRVGFLLLLSSGFALPDTVILPYAYASTEGPSSLPLGPAGGAHYQEVFGPALFSALGPIELTGVSVRADVANLLTSGSTDLTILISTSSALPGSLSSTFATNQGASPVTVFSAPYTFSTSNTGTPKPFDMTITFTTPFFYNPAAGASLVFDVLTSSAVTDGTNVMRLDAAFAGTVTRIGSVVGTSTSTTGTVFPGGLVAEFNYNSVPEPGTMGALGLGLLTLAGYSRRRRQ